MKVIISLFIILALFGCASKKNLDKNINNSTKRETVVKKMTEVDGDIASGTWNGTMRKLESPLQSAVFHDDIKSLKQFLKDGHDINFVNSEGENLLHIAAQYSGLEMNVFLINHGVDINKNAFGGNSPASLACRYRSIKLLKLYLQNGVDFKKLERNLIMTIYKRSPEGGSEIIELLIEKGYDINENYHGNIDHVLAYDIAAYLELLIRKGIKFKEIDENGWTSLHWAAYYNAYDCAKVLKKYNELHRKTKVPFEYHAYIGNDDKKITYEAGLLPVDIAKINKNTETIKVLSE